MSEPVRVLLVGGAGFLGTHVARAFRGAGHAVSVISRGSRPAPEGCEPLIADRREQGSLSAVLEGRSWDFTVDITAYDAEDVERLLLVPYSALGRYTMISSGQVYLVTETPVVPCREPESEGALRPEPLPGTPDHAQWSYGVGKRRAERAVLALRASHGVRALILRLPILQGAGDSSLRLWAWIERLLDRGPLLLPDGGVRPTRHLWAEDVAHALVRLAEGPPPREAAYNLAQPDIVSLRELIERVAAVLGVTPPFVEVAWSELEAAGLPPDFAPYAGRWASVLDASRAAADWGFEPTRLDEYLPGVVRAHLQHPPAASHPGYAHRPRERAIAEALRAAGSREASEP